MEPQWWQWMVLGIGLTIAELAVPAFVLIWFGAGAVMVGLVALVLPGLGASTQIALWTFASVAMVALWFRVFDEKRPRTRVGQSDADTVGEIGLMSRAVAPFERGRVRFQKPLLGADEWACIADEAIPAGERVRVVTVEGSLLKVERVARP